MPKLDQNALKLGLSLILTTRSEGRLGPIISFCAALYAVTAPQVSLAQMDNNFFNGGGIRIGDSTTTCTGNGGGLRFDADSSDGGGLHYCDGSSWLNILTGSIAGDVSQGGNSYTAPMVIGTNDNNTLSFETNGSTRMTVDTSGNVGIGTSTAYNTLHVFGGNIMAEATNVTTPVSLKLLEASNGGADGTGVHLHYDSSNNRLEFRGYLNNALEGTPMTVERNGSVGIGTNDPTSWFTESKLGVQGDSSGPVLVHVLSDTGQDAGVVIATPSTGNDAAIWLDDSDSQSLKISVGGEVNTNTARETNTAVTIRNNGNVGIGTTSPNVALDVIGDIELTGSITDVSDRRRKQNIKPINNALETIASVNGVSFVMKGDDKKRIEFGVIAQDVEEVIPDLVHTADDEPKTKSVNYMGFIGWIIEAIKDLALRSDDLQSKVEKRDQRISELEQELHQQKKEIEALKALFEKGSK